MFRFTLQGRIGRLERAKNASEIARISIASERQVDGQDGPYARTEWLACVSFDPALSDRLMNELAVGELVTLEGRIEPRKRLVGDINIVDHAFVITAFAAQPKAKAGMPSKSNKPEVAA